MRLIDADAELKEAKELSGPQTGDGWDNWGVYALIERQPTIDAVQVVRCKDCRWWIPHGKETPASIPALGECQFKDRKFGTACWEFCFWGERKTGE